MKFHPRPWRVEETADTIYVKAANGEHVCMMMWPGHPAHETEQATDATLEAAERIVAAENARDGA